jgi:hypothetical protein
MVTETQLPETGQIVRVRSRTWLAEDIDADHNYDSSVALDQIGRRQVKTIEDNDITDSSYENSPFTYQDDIDPVEMAGFSIRKT